MFGNRNKMTTEEINNLKANYEAAKGFVNDALEVGGNFGATISDMRASQERGSDGVGQVHKNVVGASNVIRQNADVEAGLSHSLDELRETMEQSEGEYDQVVEKISQVTDECANLVEANKHYTNPTKFLAEAGNELNKRSEEYRARLDDMDNFSKQMGVMALNAAIEAGRMGDAGKDFISAAEEIRIYTGTYTQTVERMRSDIDNTDKYVEKLEEQIHHLTQLLKDSNVAAGKLLKQNLELKKMVENSSIRPYSTEVAAARMQILNIQEAEEEIYKAEERNRLQVEDVLEELEMQRGAVEELNKKVSPLFDKAKTLR